MNPSPLRAGVVGLGIMGGGIAVCLARSEHPLSVFDINPIAAKQWPDGHLVPPVDANCADVARKSDVVMIVVINAKQVWSVLNGPDGLLAGAHPGLVIVVCSTIEMHELQEMQKAVAAAGATLVDCGVTCPPGETTKKRIVGMVGAESEVFERIQPVLEAFTQRVFLMGGPGAGMTTKIVRNMMYYAGWRAAYEAKKLAEGMGGIDLANMAEINALSEADGSGSTFWLRCWASGDYMPTGSMATRQHLTQGLLKDLTAAKELADLSEMEIPILDIMLQEPEQTTSAWSSDKRSEK
jgi:3-hydroxyisobutyrate dehydrogenase